MAVVNDECEMDAGQRVLTLDCNTVTELEVRLEFCSLLSLLSSDSSRSTSRHHAVKIIQTVLIDLNPRVLKHQLSSTYNSELDAMHAFDCAINPHCIPTVQDKIKLVCG